MNKNWICLGIVVLFLSGCAAEIATPRDASSRGPCPEGTLEERVECYQRAYDRVVEAAGKAKTTSAPKGVEAAPKPQKQGHPFPELGTVPYVPLQPGMLIMPVWTPNVQGDCIPGYDIVVENSKKSGYPYVEIQGNNLALCRPLDAVAIPVKEGSGLRWAIVVPGGSRQRYTYLGDGPFRITTVAYGPSKPDLETGQFRAAALGLSRDDDLRFNRKHAAWDWTIKPGSLY